MALETSQFHQDLAEKLSREPQTKGGLPSKLLMFSVSIFIIALVIYLGIIFGYEPYLNAQLDKLNNQISVANSQISPTDQSQLTSYISQTSNVKALLNNHITASALFNYLEKNTDTNVYFNRLSLTVFNDQAQLNGFAQTMNDLVGQLAIWQSSPSITEVDFNQISATPQGFSFGATLTFQPNFLISQSQSQ